MTRKLRSYKVFAFAMAGGLTAGARILRADSGAEVTCQELATTGEGPMVWFLDERGRIQARQVLEVIPAGGEEVFAVRLVSGGRVEASADTGFVTLDGWTPLRALAIGGRVSLPRRVP